MALSQTDLDALDAAIAGAVLTVEIDGRRVTYRSTSELMSARAHVASVIQSASGARRSVFYFQPAGRRD
jgi:hypothetical protein